MKTVQFIAEDGLTITADYYERPDAAGIIVLCHRSHFNRGEYREIAPELGELGYSCLAVDQRSGMKVLGFTNETYRLAKERGLATGYIEAKPDIAAAIDYAYELGDRQPVILLGSSYSASLALLLASEGNRKISAVVAFSPGEYLKGVRLADRVGSIQVPTLVLSARKEIEDTDILLQNASKKLVVQYRPDTEGAHGARVLWSKTPDNEVYWEKLRDFLDHNASRGAGG